MATRKKAVRKSARKPVTIDVPVLRDPSSDIGQGAPSMLHIPAHMQMQLQSPTPVQIPYFSASALHIQGTGNEFVLTFSRAMPIQTPNGIDQTRAMSQPVVLLSLSPQTVKDIAFVLNRTIDSHEKKFGKIQTPFTQRQAADVNKKTSRKKARKSR